MARELGFQPKTLIGNIPSPSQTWKLPVAEWVRSCYEERFGSGEPLDDAVSAAAPPSRSEPDNPDHPWPDRPVIVPPRPPEDFFALDEEFDDAETQFHERAFEPPSDEEIEEDNHHMARRQCLFRWAAQAIAVALSELPEVLEIAAFGSVEPKAPLLDKARGFLVRLPVIEEPPDFDTSPYDEDVPF
ncbi:MAG: hypothetical protein LC126_29860 [Bryobacterales bacterium]|nr:hypothetical protein [Bryobacterales bacterium]